MAFVLKSKTKSEKSAAARDVTGLAGFNLSDLADEGRRQLEQCRSQVRQMLAEAEHDAKAIREEAQKQGYQAGQKKAAIDADRKLQAESELRAKESLKVIRDAVTQLHSSHQDWMQQYAEVLTRTSIAAAERIVQRKLEQESEILLQWAADAVHSTRAATNLAVAVHPETLAQLGPEFDKLLASPDLPEQTHVEPDESVDRHSVVVRQRGGSIEAGLRAQLDRLEELLS
jgi:flagellar assembly protein FliH